MSNSENRMDELLKSRLEQFTPEPPERVWSSIQAKLTEKKQVRGVVFIRWMAAAAVLLLALVTGLLLTENNNQIPPQIVEKTIVPATKPQLQPDESTEQTTAKTNLNALPAKINTPETIPAAYTSQKSNFQYVESESNSAIATIRFSMRLLKPLLSSLKIPERKSQLAEMAQNKIYAAEILSENDKLKMTENLSSVTNEKSLENLWKVGLLVSPGYSSHTARHSDIYARNMSVSEHKATALIGGGLSVQYKTSGRWRIESGVYYSKNSDISGNGGGSDLFFSPSADFAYLSSDNRAKQFNNTVIIDNGQLAMNSTAGVINFNKTPAHAELIALPETAIGLNTTMLSTGEFSQIFDFVEIPLHARYSVVDSRIGVELMGGLSTNIVVANKVFMETSSGREMVGSTSNISTMNFSGTLGIGLNYSLSRNLSLSVEPRANYFLNSLNHSNDVNFRPWRIGIFTGLDFEF